MEAIERMIDNKLKDKKNGNNILKQLLIGVGIVIISALILFLFTAFSKIDQIDTNKTDIKELGDKVEKKLERIEDKIDKILLR